MATKPVSPALQSGNSLAAGLVVGLMLGEGTGTTSTDLSGNSRNGTLGGGATWTTDSAGNAVACSGGGKISVPFPAVASGDSLSFLVIHKPTSWPNVFIPLFDDTARNWSLFFDTSGNKDFGSVMIAIGGHEAMSAGTLWQYLYVRDISGNTAKVYVNGSVTDSSTSGSAATGAVTLDFGDNPSTGAGGFYTGLYDEICLWNRALTGAEIAALVTDPYQMFRVLDYFAPRVDPASHLVGPPAMRQGWRGPQQIYSPELAPLTNQEFATRVNIPNHLVGPMVMRQGWRAQRPAFDTTVSSGNRRRRLICSSA